jgi:DNA polymerase-3 subunit delta'
VARAEALAVADSFRGGEGAERFDRVMERLVAAVARRAKDGQGGAEWAELWRRLNDLRERAAGLNMDKGDALAGALVDLERTRRRAC